MFRQVVKNFTFVLLLAKGSIAVSIAGAAKPPGELLHRLQDLVQQGNVQSAHRELKTAIQQFPSEPELYNLLGVVDAERGSRKDAEADFRKAVALAPTFTGAWLNLGRFYLARAANDAASSAQALAVYNKILRYESSNSEALYQSAALLESAGSYRTSLSHLDQLPTEAQGRAQVLAVRCADQAALHKGDQAASTAEQLLAAPDLTQGDVSAILPELEVRQEPLAVWMLEAMVVRQMAGREDLSWLGQHYEHEEKLPQARETLEHAEQAGQPSVEILSELARVAYQQHDREGALVYLAQARALDARNAALHFFFGVVCIELNLPLEARKSLDEAVRLDPKNPYYNYALGSVALHGRDPGQAVPYFEKFIAGKPNDPRGRFALGVARFYMADYGDATKELRAATANQQSASGAHYFLGRIAKLQDDLPEAEKQLTEALKADPQFADALAELGLLHIKLRQYDRAAEELQRAFSFAPDNFRVNADLLILYQKTADPRIAEQQERFEEIKKKRAEDEQLLSRTIEVRPY